VTAQGDSLEHMNAVPPLHPDAAFGSARGWLEMSQVPTGFDPEARVVFPDQAQEGLQQSQYLVVVPMQYQRQCYSSRNFNVPQMSPNPLHSVMRKLLKMLRLVGHSARKTIRSNSTKETFEWGRINPRICIPVPEA